MCDVILEARLVGDIKGQFFVPSYQRGYRWTQIEVKRLLDDIYTNGDKPYCLQPVVVKNDGNSYELIDGQQRLTTLFLIYKYMADCSGGFLGQPKFTLVYETRKSSEAFLSNEGRLDTTKKDENIDYFHICTAYEVIKNWFEQRDKRSVITDFNKYLDAHVSVVWYEVGRKEDANALFRRLNIGKIPLTSSDLIKAIFMQDESVNRKEIALLWDAMETELQEESFWLFLTDKNKRGYNTHLDLVLDLMAGNTYNSSDEYATFIYFSEQLASKKEYTVALWEDIRHTFFTLKGWFESHELYHKIGYLISCGKVDLQSIYNNYKGKKKNEFDEYLKKEISKTVELPDGMSYSDLSYETNSTLLRNILLLFNVVSVEKLDNGSQRFSFSKFKSNNWSLEHINAQQSKPLVKLEDWKKWLELHIPHIKKRNSNTSDRDSKLLADVNKMLKRKKFSKDDFDSLQSQVLDFLCEGGIEQMHTLDNLALLSCSNNAALSNSIFAVKRNKIIQMDKDGEFIPHCTKMVFLKYYSSSADNQLDFWSPDDRNVYIDAINEKLADYLQEKISMENS